MKLCKKCWLEKPINEFSKSKYRKSGTRTYCKSCGAEARMDWYRSNKDKASLTCANYYEKNKTQIKLRVKEYAKQRRAIDITYRITCNLRRRLLNAIQGNNKSKRTLELLGCTVKELQIYLSSKFQPDMTWENYGQWHIDHKIPCSQFDLSKPSEQEKCFHYSNLQPLWAKDNLKKSSKFSNPRN